MVMVALRGLQSIKEKGAVVMYIEEHFLYKVYL